MCSPSGAHPGPACYRKGGPLTITDANVVLGRVRAERFPHIFGPTQDQPLDVEAARRAFAQASAVALLLLNISLTHLLFYSSRRKSTCF